MALSMLPRCRCCCYAYEVMPEWIINLTTRNDVLLWCLTSHVYKKKINKLT